MRQLLRTFLTLTFFIGGFSALWAQPTQIWDKSFGGNKGDILVKTLPLSDGNYLLAGYSNSPVSGNKSVNNKGGFDYWIVKVKPDGTKIWDKTYGGSGDEFLADIVQTNDGGFLIAGKSSTSFPNQDRTVNRSAPLLQPNNWNECDSWFIRINANGTKIWDKTLPYFSFAHSPSDNNTRDWEEHVPFLVENIVGHMWSD
jgi:hypothetical protein